MKRIGNALLLTTVLLVAVGLLFSVAWANFGKFLKYVDILAVLETTTATCGTLLGIITAGLMFTQGKYSELTSELTEKSPEYLSKVLPLEKLRAIETSLLRLRKIFTQLGTGTEVAEERSLYEGIVKKTSVMLVNFAVLTNLKMKQQGLPDAADLLISEMDPTLYETYRERRQSIKREWQTLGVIKEIVDLWEGSPAVLDKRLSARSSLRKDIENSISVMKLTDVGKDSAAILVDIGKMLDEISNEIDEISIKLHEDRIPQLLIQMKQASVISGKYFFMPLVCIATPLLANLLALPFFSETTATLFQPLILATSMLSIVGVVLLLLYANKILNV